jgi:hypothetical protein
MNEEKKALKAIIDPCDAVDKAINFVDVKLTLLPHLILLTLVFCALR